MTNVSTSLTEDGVFTLEGVRYRLAASWFPWRGELNLTLLLSSPRKGTYFGKVLLVNERTDKTVRYVKIQATFDDDNELLPLYVGVGEWVFPEAGQYSFQIFFTAREADEALKGEHPLIVFSLE